MLVGNNHRLRHSGMLPHRCKRAAEQILYAARGEYYGLLHTAQITVYSQRNAARTMVHLPGPGGVSYALCGGTEIFCANKKIVYF